MLLITVIDMSMYVDSGDGTELEATQFDAITHVRHVEDILTYSCLNPKSDLSRLGELNRVQLNTQTLIHAN